jgi:hypothetical protein
MEFLTDLIWVGNTLYPRWVVFAPFILIFAPALIVAIWRTPV